jgi:hypothetical protein
VSAAPPPVFVDDTGRRRILTRRAGRIVVLGFTGYLGLVALGFARDPGVGPVHLPTFGLPSLGLVVPPAPVVAAAQATRTAADAQVGPAEQASAPNAQGEGPSTAPAGSGTTTRPTGPSRAGNPTASRAAAPNTGLPASNTSTTTAPSTSTSSTVTTTSSTPTTTLPGQGQGQGPLQRSDAASTKGPTNSEPPGQQRKTTTTTAG